MASHQFDEIDDSLADKLRVLLDSNRGLDGEENKDGKTNAQLLAERLVQGALDGDVNCMRIILERTEGLPASNFEESDAIAELQAQVAELRSLPSHSGETAATPRGR